MVRVRGIRDEVGHPNDITGGAAVLAFDDADDASVTGGSLNAAGVELGKL